MQDFYKIPDVRPKPPNLTMRTGIPGSAVRYWSRKFPDIPPRKPLFEHMPNPSSSICLTMVWARRWASTLPCGSKARCDTSALTNNMARGVGASNRHRRRSQCVPHRKDLCLVLLNGNSVAILRRSRTDRDVAAEACMMRSKAGGPPRISEDREGAGAVRLDDDDVAVLVKRMCNWQVAVPLFGDAAGPLIQQSRCRRCPPGSRAQR